MGGQELRAKPEPRAKPNIKRGEGFVEGAQQAPRTFSKIPT